MFSSVNLVDILSGLSVVIAIMVFILGWMERRKYTRRQNTIAILISVYGDVPLENARTKLAIWVGQKREINGKEISEEDHRYVISVLDFYDLIARLTIDGDLDKNIIVGQRGGSMKAIYNLCRVYIADRRDVLGRPNLYQYLQKFVEEHVEMEKH